MGQTSIIDDIQISIKINSQEFIKEISKIQDWVKDLQKTIEKQLRRTSLNMKFFVI